MASSLTILGHQEQLICMKELILKSLQTALRHKNIQTTQGYVKQTVQDLKAELSFDLLESKNRR
jgi:DNA polymerase II large subunit